MRNQFSQHSDYTCDVRCKTDPCRAPACSHAGLAAIGSRLWWRCVPRLPCVLVQQPECAYHCFSKAAIQTGRWYILGILVREKLSFRGLLRLQISFFSLTVSFREKICLVQMKKCLSLKLHFCLRSTVVRNKEEKNLFFATSKSTAERNICWLSHPSHLYSSKSEDSGSKGIFYIKMTSAHVFLAKVNRSSCCSIYHVQPWNSFPHTHHSLF